MIKKAYFIEFSEISGALDVAFSSYIYMRSSLPRVSKNKY